MKVCIDPGHGGNDPGTEGNGLHEKDLTLDISLKLKPLLEYNGINAVLTREGDYSPGHLEGDHKGELRARVDIAEKSKVNLFISIHVNAGGGTGEEILIIAKGARAETAANTVLPYLVQVGGWANRGVKVQNVLVLRETSMPAILTENGFIDNSTDAMKLKDPNFRYALARAHAQGICDYFGIQYKDMMSPTLKQDVMYRIIIDGKQVMALSSQENAIVEMKKLVDNGQASKGIVQRNTDGVNIFEYSKSQDSSINSGSQSETPKSQLEDRQTPIMGNETITVEQCQQFLLRYNSNAPGIIPFYKKYGELLGIRWGLAVAQMIKETGYLKFGGDVVPEQNNFAGIGAVGGGEQGAVFSSPEEGVLAHLEHLFAYASLDRLPVGVTKLDPRFELVKRGSCLNWEDLNGHWAVPGNGYGEDIVYIYGKMVSEVVTTTPFGNKAIGLLRQLLIAIRELFSEK
ncbi:N-acetylmuramoyl-L-alanine amidase [Desulfosporosinus sp. OT]|uniref:N-acetylmuramoyl-L-alanine amidase n=1 Tax=Desulfosporosinus sp. OT TaxID=913865 RepID=UPI000223AF5A|nr:N-acetylmuramoyl-L-alanine amidase [Desulfosporosinus sp. OT]EGW38250.1 sporulation-specific N-acetylmuramoyl-L-alanine amidase domain protein [Desulfosporosinus sp. OT]